MKGRVMGIDFGTRHIGIALSDEMRIIASGFETVNWNGEDDSWALNRICEIIKEKNVVEIVLGKPSRTDGTESESERKAKAFGDKLASLSGIEPVYRDERFTTVVAHRFLSDSGLKTEKHKGLVDAVSAAIILQDYLDRNKKQ